MDEKEFHTPKADNVSLEQSKKQLWLHIQKKACLKINWYQALMNFLWKSKKFFAGSIAILLVVALLSTQLPFGPFKPLEVQAAFEMTADQYDAAGVDPQTTFTLSANQNLDAEVVQENLKVDPELNFEVQKQGDKFKIIPEEPLNPDGVYHFSITSEVNGKPTEFSWAYQVKNTFKITGSFPSDESNLVVTNTGIEIYFSHEKYDFEHIKNYFEITPNVEGRFENHYRTLSFVPAEELKSGTVYTVNLKAGLPLKGTDQALQQAYSFSFATGLKPEEESEYDGEGVSFRESFYEVAENTTIGLSTNDYMYYQKQEKDPVQVAVYQFETAEDYIDAFRQKTQIPTWAYNLKHEPIVTDSLTEVGIMEALRDQGQNGTYLYLPTAQLQKGYYLLEIKNELSASQALLQVTNISAYVNITQTQSLLWVNHIGNGKPIESAMVETIGGDFLGNTDKQGISTFKTPSELKNPDQQNILKIHSENDELITLVRKYPDGNDLKANYWYSFSTDRPTYKGNDTIKFWGNIHSRNNRSSTTEMKLQLVKGGSVNDAIVIQEKPLSLSQHGFFSDSFTFKELSPDNYYLLLFQGENLIEQRYIAIQNYVKPAYQIQVELDKKAYFAGETIQAKIQSNFFDGTPVSNTELTYNSSTESGHLTTNQKGETKLNLLATPAEGNNQSAFYLTLQPTHSEISDIHENVNATVFNSKIGIGVQGKAEGEKGIVRIQSHKIDLKQFEETGDALGQLVPNREISGKIIEISSEKKEREEYYDYLHKVTKKRYFYNTVEKHLADFKVKTDEKGEAEYQFKLEPDKYYRIQLESKDDDGQTSYQSVFVYGSMEREVDRDYLYIRLPDDQDNSPRNYDLGETVEVKVGQGNGLLNPKVKGEFLFLTFNNGLMTSTISKNPEHNFEFKEEHLPKSYLSGVWFDGQNYLMINYSPVNYKKELRELSIDVATDQTRYEPGDKVTLDIQVNDAQGKGVAAQVNVNLVDEAYYKVVYDQLNNPLDDLYDNNIIGEIYSYITHKNPLMTMIDGGDRGGCFVKGTRVLMSDGTYKPIELIGAGDWILTKKSFYSSQMVAAKVQSTISHKVNGYLVINEKLKVTPEHVLFVNGVFELAGEVKKGDRLLNKQGEWVEVTSVRQVTEPVEVYNFEVQDQHTYFAEDFYVHNDKGGDGIRNDFEDNALFETLETGKDGKATFTFQLPDNITSWRVSAKAIDAKNWQAGLGTGVVEVGLPLFADLVVNREYSIQDQPQIQFRAYGTALKEGDDVDFEVESTTLNLNEKVTGKAFQKSSLALPGLKQGLHELFLRAQSGNLSDAMSLPIEVVGSRLSRHYLTFLPDVTAGSSLPISDAGPTEITFVDTGRAAFYHQLLGLIQQKGNRLDEALVPVAGKELMEKYFDAPMRLPKTFSSSLYQADDLGLKLLPHAGSDLKLTTLALLMDPNPERFNRAQVNNHLYGIYKDTHSNLDEIVLALAGLSSNQEPVLTSLTELKKEPQLRQQDQLWIGLAFNALGDQTQAREMYQQVEELTQTSGQEEALKAILAAALNQPEAKDLWEEALKHQKNDEALYLYQLGYVKEALKWASPQEAEFTWVQNGKEKKVQLGLNETYSTLVFPDDTFAIKEGAGKIDAIVHWNEKVDPQTIQNADQLTVERYYTVKGVTKNTVQEGDLVEVRLKVQVFHKDQQWGMNFNPNVKITDILPSGLTPVTSVNVYNKNVSHAYGIEYPYMIDGQELSFMWFPDFYETDMETTPGSQKTVTNPSPEKEIYYLARVVNPGIFYAEPARVEFMEDPELASFSQESWLTIEEAE